MTTINKQISVALTSQPFHSFCFSRDFQFKIKGISMSVFTEEDVAAMASEGNVSFNAKYLANYNTHDPMPSGADVTKLKDFIKAKYLDRKWFNDGTNSGGNSGGFGAFDAGTGAGGVGKSTRRSVRLLILYVYVRVCYVYGVESSPFCVHSCTPFCWIRLCGYTVM